jgi:hypothetical protein
MFSGRELFVKFSIGENGELVENVVETWEENSLRFPSVKLKDDISTSKISALLSKCIIDGRFDSESKYFEPFAVSLDEYFDSVCDDSKSKLKKECLDLFTKFGLIRLRNEKAKLSKEEMVRFLS